MTNKHTHSFSGGCGHGDEGGERSKDKDKGGPGRWAEVVGAGSRAQRSE